MKTKRTKLRLDKCEHLENPVIGDDGEPLRSCGAGPVHWCKKRKENVTPLARCSKYHSCYGASDAPPLQYCEDHSSNGDPVFVDLGLPEEVKAEIIAKQEIPVLGTVDLKTFYDAVYIINRAERTDRWLSCQKQFMSTNWPFQDPIRVEAVEGDSLQIPKGWDGSVGAYGCLQSHIKVCDLAIQSGHSKVLILEDDFRLVGNFPTRLAKFIQHVPGDWDGIWLGGGKKRSWDKGNGVVQLLHSALAHGYSLRRNAIQRYRKFISNPSINRDFDTVFANLMPRFKIYAPDQWMIHQSGSPSDNRGVVPSPAPLKSDLWKKELEQSLKI
jgi:GR25 family glycosyltransferase involved in LPS biosynthesis